jgi:hypothetical protein
MAATSASCMKATSRYVYLCPMVSPKIYEIFVMDFFGTLNYIVTRRSLRLYLAFRSMTTVNHIKFCMEASTW